MFAGNFLCLWARAVGSSGGCKQNRRDCSESEYERASLTFVLFWRTTKETQWYHKWMQLRGSLQLGPSVTLLKGWYEMDEQSILMLLAWGAPGAQSQRLPSGWKDKHSICTHKENVSLTRQAELHPGKIPHALRKEIKINILFQNTFLFPAFSDFCKLHVCCLAFKSKQQWYVK